MDTLDRESWLLLRELSRSGEGLLAFTIHRRLSITAGQLASTVRKLVAQGLVLLDENDDRLTVTAKGIELLQAAGRGRADRSSQQGEVSWIYRPRMAINTPYVPRKSLF